MAKKCHLFLQVIRILLEGVRGANLRFFLSASSDVVEAVALGTQDNFRRVVEVNADIFVRKDLSNTVLARVVHPFRDPELWQSSRLYLHHLRASARRRLGPTEASCEVDLGRAAYAR